ncbi:MAG: hypothetical protein ABI379_08575 [Rhodanobacter sp.]
MSKAHRLLAVVIAAGLTNALPACLAETVAPAALTSALHWRSVGPYLGGRVIAVTGVVQQPSHFYMGAVGGGVWESEDYGNNWKNISDKYFDSNNIGAIAVAPSDANVIYVGTGEADIRNTFLTGEGMYKSTDAGKTWTKIGLAATHTISHIEVDPHNADIVYAASMGHVFAENPERGVFKSVDGGQTWKKILYVDAKTGAIDLAMDPTNAQVLYATMWQAYRRPWELSSGGPGSGIYKSTDGGATWANITHNPGLPAGIFGRSGVAISRSKPDRMYAVIQAAYKDQAGGLFRSDNAGKSWELVNNSQDLTQRAFYYSQVFVDPKDPDTIYLPQVDALWVSHDAGKTISAIKTPHGDNHAMWINPDNPAVMIEANDGGASVSIDTGKNWSPLTNQPTGQFYHVNLDHQFPFNIYGAQQDEGSYFGPSAVAKGGIPGEWTTVIGGEASWVVPKPGEPWVTFASGDYSQLWKEDRRLKLITNVSPWPSYKYGLSAAELKYRYEWTHHPILFAPGDDNKLLVAANVVLQSQDDGINWKAISPDLTRDDKSKQQRSGGPISADMSGAELWPAITALAVSPLAHGVMWAGSGDGLVHVSTDAGGHWNAVRPPDLPEWSTITCIEASSAAAGTAYMTASRYRWDDFKPYVYKTTDYGKHWTTIIAGLPGDQYVETVREDAGAPNLLFAGTSKTVFMSLDAGAHWLPLALNLPVVRISDIAIQAAQHAVVLGTHGRGFWTLDNLAFLEQVSSAPVADDASYLFKPQQTWLVTRETGGDNAAGPHQGANLPAGATVFFHLPSNYDSHTPVKLSFTTADGHLINSYSLPQVDEDTHKPGPALHPGMNRFQWDLRYKAAVDVKGIYRSKGFPPTPPIGPDVMPGTYNAVLSVGSSRLTQPFAVKLDPSLPTTQAQLQERFDLLMQIHDALNSLDTSLNEAIDMRTELQQALAGEKVTAAGANKAMADLNKDIDALVNLKIQAGEGALVYPGRLRAWLTTLASRVGVAYVQPTPAMTQVAKEYIEQQRAGVARLQADIVQAKAVLH